MTNSPPAPPSDRKSPSGATLSGSGAMFDRIAKRYDVMNRLISFGLDKGWRKKLLEQLGPIKSGDQVLDVATGTADVALAIANFAPEVAITGLDPSSGMLEVGRRKISAQGKGNRIKLVLGDAQQIPFEDNHFTASCISFGIRNVPNRLKGIEEMVRTTKVGGKVVILELSEPRTGLLAPFARFHIHHIVPTLGSVLSGASEYRYLQQSIQAFPPASEFADLMTSCGLKNVIIQKLTLGTAHLYTGTVG